MSEGWKLGSMESSEWMHCDGACVPPTGESASFLPLNIIRLICLNTNNFLHTALQRWVKKAMHQSARRPSFRPFPDRLMTMIPSYVFPNKGHGPTRNLCSNSYCWPLGLGSWRIVVNHAPDLQRIHAWCILSALCFLRVCKGKRSSFDRLCASTSQQAASKEWPVVVM
jgi:hypothetical protein